MYDISQTTVYYLKRLVILYTNHKGETVHYRECAADKK